MNVEEKFDEKAFKRMTEEMEKKRPRLKEVTPTDIPTFNYSGHGKTEQVRKKHQTLKEKFLESYDETILVKYVQKWCKAINGHDFAYSMFELPALLDYFEALNLGQSEVSSRAIEIGLSKIGK